VEEPVRLTPLDLQNHRFTRSLRGYDPEEVQAFLRIVAEDLEGVTRESELLRERLRELESRVQEMGAREEALRDTLVTAQSVSEDLRRTATKEAELTVAEAEVKAEKILDAAHRRLARLSEDIRDLRQLRTRLAASVRAAFETHLALLDGLAADPPEEALLEARSAQPHPSAPGAPIRVLRRPGPPGTPSSSAEEA
jgi:cell division initiation protein